MIHSPNQRVCDLYDYQNENVNAAVTVNFISCTQTDEYYSTHCNVTKLSADQMLKLEFKSVCLYNNKKGSFCNVSLMCRYGVF